MPETPAGVTVKQIFQLMPTRFNKDAAKGLDATYQFDLSGDGGGKWAISIANDQCMVKEGGVPNPNITISMTAQDFLDMISGKPNGQDAFAGGKVRFAGDIQLALRILNLFSVDSEDKDKIKIIHDAAGHKMGDNWPRDRSNAISWARGLLSSPNSWLIIDTETTGLRGIDEVVQIGLLAADGTAVMDSLVRPVKRKTMPREAFEIHGISMEMLAGAPTYRELAPRLLEIVRYKTLISYNAAYDSRLLNQTALRSGGPKVPSHWECAMIQYARFFGQWDDWKNDYKWQRLPRAEHGAIGDCRATLKIIHEMTQAEPFPLSDSKLRNLDGNLLPLAITRPPGWEYLLFSVALEGAIQSLSDIKRDWEYGLATGTGTAMAPRQFID
ncbi:MAG: SCP2 sterol-binding domain-containing protein [Candidatus Binataceae bacterium]